MRARLWLGTTTSVLLLSGTGLAQVSPSTTRTNSPADAAVYFVDLKEGARISTSATIRFGLRNMGVAPAGVEKDQSGHHHLLIDTELPNPDEPIPNDANHLHFGAGQTETSLNLSPGEHTLQLALADKDHRLHDPPVLSERIRVTVSDAAATQEPGKDKANSRKPSPVDARAYIISPLSGARVGRSFRVRFGLLNMGIAPAGVEKTGTGHHHLLIDTALHNVDVPIPNDSNHLHFGAGQTEARITLPPGEHTLQLLMADENHVPHNPPIFSEIIRVKVGTEPKPSRPRRTKNR
jgi:hypothetical protein